MILPTKRLGQDRALLVVGGEILGLLSEPKTVSRLWEEVKRARSSRAGNPPLMYDWFVLALDFLYAVSAVEIEKGRIRKSSP